MNEEKQNTVVKLRSAVWDVSSAADLKQRGVKIRSLKEITRDGFLPIIPGDDSKTRVRVGPELSALIDLRDANPSLQQKGGWSGLSQSSDLARVSLDGVTVSGGRVTKLKLNDCGLTGTSRSVVVPPIP